MDILGFLNAKVVRTFASGVLIVLGFSTFLAYGIVTIALLFDKHFTTDVFVLICVLAFFPGLACMGFLWLLLHHFDKAVSKTVRVN